VGHAGGRRGRDHRLRPAQAALAANPGPGRQVVLEAGACGDVDHDVETAERLDQRGVAGVGVAVQGATHVDRLGVDGDDVTDAATRARPPGTPPGCRNDEAAEDRLARGPGGAHHGDVQRATPRANGTPGGTHCGLRVVV
jgi:hypothetical protein